MIRRNDGPIPESIELIYYVQKKKNLKWNKGDKMANDKTLTTKYSLEIHKPDCARDVWVNFSSATPFLGISKGDIINPTLWPDSQSPMKVLKVVSVEHMIWEIEGSHITHKVCVFTKEVEGKEELRLKE